MQVDFSISINFECLSSLHRRYFSIKFLYTFVIIKFFFGRSRNILYSKRIIFVSIISFFHQGIFHTFISLIILINEYSYSVTHFLRSFSLSFYLHVRFLEKPSTHAFRQRIISNDLDNSSPIHYRDLRREELFKNRSRANER